MCIAMVRLLSYKTVLGKIALTKSAIAPLKINIDSVVLTVFETFKNIDFHIFFTFSKTVFRHKTCFCRTMAMHL